MCTSIRRLLQHYRRWRARCLRHRAEEAVEQAYGLLQDATDDATEAARLERGDR